MKKVRIKREKEWEFVLEDSLTKLQRAKQMVLELVEGFFKDVEEKLVKQYLKPAKECSIERIELPVKVKIISI